MKPTLTPEDRRLLFALLDAAADDGLLLADSPAGRRWQELRVAAVATDFQAAEPLYALLEEVERAGLLDATWIKDRWLGVRARFEATRNPFGVTPRAPA
jgi:hypothetical protein